MTISTPAKRLAFWLIVVLASLATGFISGFNIRQPSLVVDQVREMRSAAEALDRLALGMQRDPRNIGEQLGALRTEAETVAPEQKRQALLGRVMTIEERLREQNDRLETTLWETHEKARALHQGLDGSLQASAGPFVTAYDHLKRLLRWLGPAVAVAILLISFAILWPPSRRWLARTQSVNAFGVEINVHDPAAVREGVRERFSQVDAAMSAAYLDKLEGADVDDLFVRLKADIDAKLKQVAGADLSTVTHRATLWVPGFTGEELVQAARYHGYPKQPDRPVVGRRFSVRYGIIGRAWRLRTTQYNWDVSNEANALVRNWGLTRREARKQGDQHNSLMAFVIQSPEPDSDPLGIVYIEAEGTNQLLPNMTPASLKRRLAGDADGRLEADKAAHEKVWQPLWDEKKADPLVGALMKLRRAFNWDVKIASGDGR